MGRDTNGEGRGREDGWDISIIRKLIFLGKFIQKPL